MYWIFAIGGYIGALLTAFYAFRIDVPRLRAASRARRRASSSRGHLAHAEPANPATGEPEDTDVGFPGPEHHIAERATPMKIAMAHPRLLRHGRRSPADPRGDRRRRHLPRADVRGLAAVAASSPPTAPPTSASRSARRWRRSGSRSPTTSTSSPRGRRAPDRAPARTRPRLPPPQVVLRRALRRRRLPAVIALGRFANSVFERVVVQGIVNGTVGVVRGVGVVVRGAQSRLRARLRAAARRRLRRARPLLPDREHRDAAAGHCSWLARVLRCAGLPSPSAARRPPLRCACWPVARHAGALGLAIALIARLRPRRRRAPARRRRVLDPRPRRPLPARRRRDQPLPRRADGAAVGGGDACRRRCARPSGRALYFFMLGLAETATLGAFLAQDLLLFVLFFDLMLIPFFFLIGTWGGENRIAATTKMIVYTLVGSLLMLVAAIATAILAADQVGQLSFSIADLRANVARRGEPGLDLLVLRRRLPGQDAGLPRPRLDAGRLPGGAAAGPGAALGRARRRSAPTASCASCCRSTPTPRPVPGRRARRSASRASSTAR